MHHTFLAMRLRFPISSLFDFSILLLLPKYRLIQLKQIVRKFTFVSWIFLCIDSDHYLCLHFSFDLCICTYTLAFFSCILCISLICALTSYHLVSLFSRSLICHYKKFNELSIVFDYLYRLYCFFCCCYFV